MTELTTERLRLRPFRTDDAGALNRINSRSEVMRYIGKPVETIRNTEDYLRESVLADYSKYGFGRHAVIEQHSGELIGFCGLKYLPDLDEVDIGYRLHPDYWGLGYATEAGQATMKFGREKLGLSRIIGIAMDENTASIEVLKKLGLKPDGRVNHLGTECARFLWQA
ncbi:GNAT family N-acetyltransferase [Saliniradius amylolyticus]|nr:GNAT family N-acetyltransferase [Saliniradius amylolyticus]